MSTMPCSPDPTQTVLVVRLGALGDVILTTGPLLHWHKTRGLRFDFLVKARFAPVLEGHPAVRRIIALEDHELRGGRWLHTALKLRRDLPESMLLDLHGNLRTMVLRLLWAGSMRRYPKLSLERRLFLSLHSQKAALRLRETNVPQRYSLALESSPSPVWKVAPRIFLQSREIQDADDLISSWAAGRKIIALHPYATHPAKAWPENSWLHLLDLLAERNLACLVLGKSGRILKTPDKVKNLTNTTDLRRTTALLSRCSALVTGDSGPMHLAWAVKTPMVALFGPTTRHWGFVPQGQGIKILEKDMDCRPCSLHGQDRCPRNKACMAQISPKEVAEAVLDLVS